MPLTLPNFRSIDERWVLTLFVPGAAAVVASMFLMTGLVLSFWLIPPFTGLTTLAPDVFERAVVIVSLSVMPFVAAVCAAVLARRRKGSIAVAWAFAPVAFAWYVGAEPGMPIHQNVPMLAVIVSALFVLLRAPGLGTLQNWDLGGVSLGIQSAKEWLIKQFREF